MGVLRLLGQGRPLVHAEPVLLVRHHQAQLPVLHVLRQQGVGADAQVDGPVRQPR